MLRVLVSGSGCRLEICRSRSRDATLDLPLDRVCTTAVHQFRMSDMQILLDAGTASRQLQPIGQIVAAPFGLR